MSPDGKVRRWRSRTAAAIAPTVAALAAVFGPVGPASAQAPPRASGPRVLDTSTPITYFIAEGSPGSAYTDSDRQLAEWALQAWAGLTDPPLALAPAEEEAATIRVYWVRAGSGLYGEMRARTLDGRPAADVFVRPDTDGLGPDIAAVARRDFLFRETVVYLTCVHELGHAFGLGHTSDFADIMYSFQYGGDIVAYFTRFRDKLEARSDVPTASPFSAADERALRALYLGR